MIHLAKQNSHHLFGPLSMEPWSTPMPGGLGGRLGADSGEKKKGTSAPPPRAARPDSSTARRQRRALVLPAPAAAYIQPQNSRLERLHTHTQRYIRRPSMAAVECVASAQVLRLASTHQRQTPPSTVQMVHHIQLQPSFHTKWTEPEPTARSPHGRRGKRILGAAR